MVKCIDDNFWVRNNYCTCYCGILKQTSEINIIQGFKYQIMELLLEFCLSICIFISQIILYIFSLSVFRILLRTKIKQLIE